MEFNEFQRYSFDEWKKVASKSDVPIEKEVQGIHTSILSTKGKDYPPLPSFPTDCIIAQRISANSPQTLRTQLLQSNHHGQQALHVDKLTLNKCFASFTQIEQSLQDTTVTEFCLEGKEGIVSLIENLCIYANTHQMLVKGVIGVSLSHDNKEELLQFANTIEEIRERKVSVKCGIIHTTSLKENRTLVDELTYFFASAVEIVEQLKEKGYSPTDVLSQLVWKCSVGSSIFMEIAKLRAFRLLWATLLEQYDVEPQAPTVICETKNSITEEENRHDTLIGATLQAFAAVVGGANYLHVSTFEGEEGIRLGRNVQHVLLQESKINRIKDPLGGAYTIESLTYELCEKAWNNFLEIERQGGIHAYNQQTLVVSRGEEA